MRMESVEVFSMRPQKRRSTELAWIVKVLLAATLLLLVLQISGVHHGGMLLRLWRQVVG